jgi:hypothetical protein
MMEKRDLLFELNQLIFDALIVGFQRDLPEEWETSDTMMVDIRVPHNARTIIKRLAQVVDKSQGQLESGIFSTLVLKGIFYCIDERDGTHPTTLEDMMDRLDEILLEHQKEVMSK